jgi:threonylcarbamoyladenosine tRNA methylthiotransferase MtaB
MDNVASFFVENFGCRATQADGAAIEGQLRDRGWERASGPSAAAVVVLNTCTVTASADQDARAAVRRIRRQNPDCRILVTGCYAQRAPDEVAALPGVTWVVGNSHKHQLAEIVASGERNGQPGAGGFVPIESLTSAAAIEVDERMFVSDIFAHTQLLGAPVFDAGHERTRPNLKVQDGCDNRCSFCVIPSVRGHSRSLPLEEVIGQVNQLAAAGYREVVISGINLGRWGRDLEKKSVAIGRSSSVNPSGQRPTTNDQRLVTLIRAILDRTSLEKLRISSVEPMDWTTEFIDLVATSPRIAKHAHVPMQSGSDAVLRRMHRKYRPWHYRDRIERIRAKMPEAAIGADVMVGFPGETDSEFEETRRMVEDLPFTYLHVFTYSSRPGTPSAAMPNQVPVRTARERNQVLRELAATKKLAFMRSFVGRELQAITLDVIHQRHDGIFTEALTDNYLKLYLAGRHASNQWVTGQVESIEDGALLGITTGDAHASLPAGAELTLL